MMRRARTRTQRCSVSTLRGRLARMTLSDYPEEQPALAGLAGHRPQGASLVGFDHAVDGLHLPALAIDRLRRSRAKEFPHPAAIGICSGLGRGPAGGRRDQRRDLQLLVSETMALFGVQARIGQQALKAPPPGAS